MSLQPHLRAILCLAVYMAIAAGAELADITADGRGV